MNNFLYFGTPVDQFLTYYKDIHVPFEKDQRIQTLLPLHFAAIRVIAVSSFTALAALKLFSTIWTVTIVTIAGATATGWLIYSNFLRNDPITEAFYKIVGGRDKFNRLPVIEFNQVDPVSDELYTIAWSDLDRPIYKGKISGDRNIIIVKGLSRDRKIKAIFSFIERTSFEDIHFPENLREIFHTLIQVITMLFIGVNRWSGEKKSSTELITGRFSKEVISLSVDGEIYQKKAIPFTANDESTMENGHQQISILSSLSTDEANEFFVQLHVHNDN